MICFYHSDADGKASAAIVRKYYLEVLKSEEELKFISINYNMTFPIDKINKDERVIIVDFSLELTDFAKVQELTPYIVWIDHHKTAIAKYSNMLIAGIRRDGTAGCELTWEYFFGDDTVPQIIKYIGDYDVWAFKYGEDTNYLTTALTTLNINPTSSLWEKWLTPHNVLDEEIALGKVLIEYRDAIYRKAVSSWAYRTEIEGFSAIACNSSDFTSQLFNSLKKDCDILIIYIHDGINWKVSLYTEKEDIDCSVIAVKYGGGGHRAACGFAVNELPFKFISKIKDN